MATASTLFLPFPGQLTRRVMWHCGRFALFLLCSIEKFACQELCKAFAKERDRASETERESGKGREGRTDEGQNCRVGQRTTRRK